MIEIHEHADGVRELRFARPPVNALNLSLVLELNTQLDAAASSRRAIVLGGQPGMFSGGLDVRDLGRLGEDDVREFLVHFVAAQQRIACCTVPIIAALTGHCPAGGTVLAVFCDYRIMARGAFRIGLNEVQVGLTPGETIFRAFARLIGPRLAGDWAMRGVLADPETALAAGLVDELADPAAVIGRAVAYARELLALPAQAFALTRQQVRADLVALFANDRNRPLVEQMLKLWFSDETRRSFAAVLSKQR